MSAKLSELVATSSLVNADLFYVAKSPFGLTDSKKITVADLKIALGTGGGGGASLGLMNAITQSIFLF